MTKERLIYADELKAMLTDMQATGGHKYYRQGANCILHEIMPQIIDDCPTVDAIPVADIEAWLYQIAMNNTGNPLCSACKEIISRLDGLRQFSRERSCKDGQ